MISGLGIDIVDIKRFRSILRKKAFLKRVYTRKEAAYCLGKKNYALHLAGRFAVKEAFIKALSDDKSIALRDIETVNNFLGKPEININATVRAAMKRKKLKHIHLSISHNDISAVAVCVLEG